MQVDDNIFLGPVFGPSQPEVGSPSTPQNGVGPMGRVYIWDVVPVTLGAALLAVAQAATGGITVLAAGAGVTTSLGADGVTRYVLDTPRNISVTAAGANTATAVVSGYDAYGQPMTESFAAPSTSTVAGNKAFKSIVSVTWSATPGSNVSVGFGDKLGLPYRLLDIGYIQAVKWAGVLATDAGTAVAAVTTTATASTGDVRGTYTPSSASNGARRLVMTLAIPGIACGPNATRVGALGVTQA
jgi:hypothetical protein